MQWSSNMMTSGGSGTRATTGAQPEGLVRTRRTRLNFLVPVAIFAVLIPALAIGLSHNPNIVPSALIGKPVPEFRLAPVQDEFLGSRAPILKATYRW